MDCNYPKCTECTLSDCEMEEKDIAALLKRRRWGRNPELYRQKQRDYRKRIKDNLPHCDECDLCVLVQKEKQDGCRRLCVEEMRLIEQKVSNSPQWCKKRQKGFDGNDNKEQAGGNGAVFETPGTGLYSGANC